MIAGRTFLCILAVAEVLIAPVEIPQKEATTVAEEYCCFCDENYELTTKEKCEELLWKALIDEKNWLDDGIITKEVYELQIQPFNKALDYLETATEEEIEMVYNDLLLVNLDWLEEDKAAGEEIDEGFYGYIISELNN